LYTDQWYYIQIKTTGKWWGVSGDYDGAQLVQTSHFHGFHQQFRMKPVGDGTYQIEARNSHKFLGISGASTQQLATVVQMEIHPRSSGQFTFERAIKNGIYYTIQTHAHMCVDLEGNFQHDLARLIQWGCHGGGNQQFAFTPVS